MPKIEVKKLNTKLSNVSKLKAAPAAQRSNTKNVHQREENNQKLDDLSILTKDEDKEKKSKSKKWNFLLMITFDLPILFFNLNSK